MRTPFACCCSGLTIAVAAFPSLLLVGGGAAAFAYTAPPSSSNGGGGWAQRGTSSNKGGNSHRHRHRYYSYSNDFYGYGYGDWSPIGPHHQPPPPPQPSYAPSWQQRQYAPQQPPLWPRPEQQQQRQPPGLRGVGDAYSPGFADTSYYNNNGYYRDDGLPRTSEYPPDNERRPPYPPSPPLQQQQRRQQQPSYVDEADVRREDPSASEPYPTNTVPFERGAANFGERGVTEPDPQGPRTTYGEVGAFERPRRRLWRASPPKAEDEVGPSSPYNYAGPGAAEVSVDNIVPSIADVTEKSPNAFAGANDGTYLNLVNAGANSDARQDDTNYNSPPSYAEDPRLARSTDEAAQRRAEEESEPSSAGAVVSPSYQSFMAGSVPALEEISAESSASSDLDCLGSISEVKGLPPAAVERRRDTEGAVAEPAAGNADDDALLQFLQKGSDQDSSAGSAISSSFSPPPPSSALLTPPQPLPRASSIPLPEESGAKGALDEVSEAAELSTDIDADLEEAAFAAYDDGVEDAAKDVVGTASGATVGDSQVEVESEPDSEAFDSVVIDAEDLSTGPDVSLAGTATTFEDADVRTISTEEKLELVEDTLDLKEKDDLSLFEEEGVVSTGAATSTAPVVNIEADVALKMKYDDFASKCPTHIFASTEAKALRFAKTSVNEEIIDDSKSKALQSIPVVAGEETIKKTEDEIPALRLSTFLFSSSEAMVLRDAKAYRQASTNMGDSSSHAPLVSASVEPTPSKAQLDVSDEVEDQIPMSRVPTYLFASGKAKAYLQAKPEQEVLAEVRDISAVEKQDEPLESSTALFSQSEAAALRQVKNSIDSSAEETSSDFFEAIDDGGDADVVVGVENETTEPNYPTFLFESSQASALLYAKASLNTRTAFLPKLESNNAVDKTMVVVADEDKEGLTLPREPTALYLLSNAKAGLWGITAKPSESPPVSRPSPQSSSHSTAKMESIDETTKSVERPRYDPKPPAVPPPRGIVNTFAEPPSPSETLLTPDPSFESEPAPFFVSELELGSDKDSARPQSSRDYIQELMTGMQNFLPEKANVTAVDLSETDGTYQKL